MYKIIKNGNQKTIRNDKGTWIPISNQNRYYIEYLKYLEDNNLTEEDLEIEDITPQKNNRVQVMYDVSLGKLVYHNGATWEIVP
jgi:hypothetical protein